MKTQAMTAISGLLLVASLASHAAADFPLPPEVTGSVYVSSYGTNEIHCYGPSGAHLFKFSHPDLRGPRGLAFSPGDELYAAAQSSDRILVFDRDGNYRRQFSGGGLDGPTGIAFDPGGEFYVSSFNTDEVLIFVSDVYDRSVSATGLDGPNCVAFGAAGDFYVVSQFTSGVYHFDAAGQFLGAFGGGGLSSAMGAAVFEDEIYVTGGASHNIAVFDLQGNFLRSITDPEINGPQGLAFDENGNFAVSSFYTGKLAHFTRAGERLQVFEEAGLRIARSVAYLPLGPEIPFLRGDYNQDTKLDISDPVAVLRHLFLGAPGNRCADAGDSNDDGKLDIADPSYTLRFLFLGGPRPPEPFPDPGNDPTEDGLMCD